MALVGPPGDGGRAQGARDRRSGTPESRPQLEELRFGQVGDEAGRVPPAPARHPPAARLESAKSDRSENNPHDAHQIDLEAQAEGHGQESQVDRRRRREPDRRPPADQVLRESGREKAAEKLPEQRADDQTGDDDQEDQPDATLGCHLGEGSQETIRGFASVTTRVCLAMLLRMNFGRLKACWWVTPSQYSSGPLILSAMSLSTVLASCRLGSTFFDATMNPHGVPKHEMKL